MSKQHIIFVSLSLGFGVGFVASACVTTYEPNPEHCRYAGGDQTCAERYGGARPFCTTAACDGDSERAYGCVTERPSDDCYYPCGGDKELALDDACLAADDDGGDGDGDGEMADTNEGGDGDADTPCLGPADCPDAAAPFCDVDSGACVGCAGTQYPDAACAELEPSMPVCVADVCVACTQNKADACVDLTPICDAQSNTCVGCSDHDQCPDSACNLAAGSCLDPAAVVHVDGDNPNCAEADGSPATPYCDIGDAITNAPEQPLLVIHARDGDAPYVEAHLISSAIAMFAAPGEAPVLQGFNNAAPLTVTPSGDLFARGLRIAGTPSGVGLAVSGGRAWVEQAQIVNNSAGGILVNGGGALVLEGSFVGGGNVNNKAALEVFEGEVSVVFSTLGAGFGDASRAVACADGSGSSVRNSLVVSYSDQPEIDCPKLDVVDSFTEADFGMDFDDSSGWFLGFDSGDFHLAPGMYPEVLATAAVWHSGDPMSDIDGDPRPSADASPDFAGADRLP